MVRGYRGRLCSRGTSFTLNASYLSSLHTFVEDVKKLVEELSFIMPGAIDKSTNFHLIFLIFRRGNSKSGCGAFNTRFR